MSSAQQSSPPALAGALGARATKSRACSRGERQRGPAVVGRGRRCPTASGRGPSGGGSRDRWRAPGSRRGRPRPARRSASRSARPPARPGCARARGARRRRGLARASGRRRRPRPRIRQLALQAGHVRALGQPEAAAPAAETAPVRGDPVRSWSRSPASVASSGRIAWLAAEVHSSTRAQRARRRRAGRGRGARTPARRRRSRPPPGAPRRPPALAAALQAARVLGVQRRPDLGQEAQVALARVAPHRLQLVAQHRGEPDGQRRAVESSSSGR